MGGALAEEPPMPKLEFREKECLENFGIFAKVLELAFCPLCLKERWAAPEKRRNLVVLQGYFCHFCPKIHVSPCEYFWLHRCH
ncbi:unnamed protein product [Malus baccata var. baccata]